MTSVDYLRCNGMKLIRVHVIHATKIIHQEYLCAIDTIVEVRCGSVVTSSIQSKTIGDIQ